MAIILWNKVKTRELQGLIYYIRMSSFVSSLHLKEIFPTASSVVIFISYMALFINQGILVTASRMGGKTYPYNPAAVVLLTEVLKFIFSSVAFIQR